MKKLLLLLIVTLGPYLYLGAQSSQNSTLDSNKIDLERQEIINGHSERPRSTYFLEATYDSISSQIEITHDCIGETTISLFDACGYMLYQTNVYSNSYTTDIIPLPTINGSYIIVISSEVVCAYGIITLQ